jgi:phosphohistidine phosphatase
MILRHAEAGQDPAAASDADRTLTARGRDDAARQGAWMTSSGFRPDRTLASTALRAVETAQLVSAAWGEDALDISWDPALYLASLRRLMLTLAKLPADGGRVLLVGHNPGLADLVEHLTGRPLAMHDRGRVFPTATLAHVVLPRGWGQLTAGCGELRLLRPPEGTDED